MKLYKIDPWNGPDRSNPGKQWYSTVAPMLVDPLDKKVRPLSIG
jgi:hypothetical protein